MKGIIVYSSKTENTKKMAQALYNGLQSTYEIDLKSITEDVDFSQYDFALCGSWINIGTLEKNILSLIEACSIPIGLFATMGASPKSIHGEEVYRNLNELLKFKKSLGAYVCPGVVSQMLIDRLDKLPDHIVSKEAKEGMREASIESKPATEQELQEAVAYFETRLKTFFEG